MVRFGVGMAPVEPLKKVVATAKLAEELGFVAALLRGRLGSAQAAD